MTSDKTLLTYKRRHISTKAHLVAGIKEGNPSHDSSKEIPLGILLPKAEPGCYIEKQLNKDSENVPQEELQCSTSSQRLDSEKSTQKQVQEKKRKRESMETSEIKPVKLISQKSLKENAFPLTFYRRGKKKQTISSSPAEENLKAEENLDQSDISALHMLQHNMVEQMANADKDVTLESAPTGASLEAKIDLVDHDHKAASNKCMEAPTINGRGDSILLMHEKRPSHDISEKCQINDLNVAFVPPSPACPSNLVESQSSNPNCIAVLDDEADGRGKESECVESLEKKLESLKKEKENMNKCTFREQSDNSYGQSSSGRALPTLANQVQYREYMNHVIPSQDRIYLAGSHNREHGETSNKPSLCTNFLPLPHNSGVPLNFINDVQILPPRSRSFHQDEASSLDNYRRCLAEWSEDELDSLWIGVRRYGLHNWNIMLRDPKLLFSPLRIPEDLARRWDLEQRKLSKPIPSSSSAMQNATLVRPSPETQLSLGIGDVYKRVQFSYSGLVSGSNSSAVSFPGGYSMVYAHPGIGHQNAPRPQLTRARKIPGYVTDDWDSSILGQKLGEVSTQEHHQQASLQASSGHPHWLRGALARPPGVRDPALPTVSAKEARSRGILKRKSRAGVPGPTIEPSNGTWVWSLQALNQRLPPQRPVPGINESGEVVVIDSDVTSEETISDS